MDIANFFIFKETDSGNLHLTIQGVATQMLYTERKEPFDNKNEVQQPRTIG